MTKFSLLVLSFGFFFTASAQSDSASRANFYKNSNPKKDWSKVNLGSRANDHFMFQLGYNSWSKMPDSLSTKGIPRTVNVYFMFDFPFKTDPRFSVGIGAGVSSSGMYFDKSAIDITGTTTKLVFSNTAKTNHYKKYKLATTYLEAPIELRYALDPEHINKSLKFALGAKIGTLLNAHTKAKNLQNSGGSLLNSYTMKLASKRYFNSTRLSGTARVGIGVFSLFGSYQINTLFKEAVAPEVHPYTIGLTISGL